MVLKPELLTDSEAQITTQTGEGRLLMAVNASSVSESEVIGGRNLVTLSLE
jgi:hypothetical protein